MDVCLLIGKSGSGKSTNSVRIASKYGSDYIIDDGLLIKTADKSIVCGRTAKSVESFDQVLLDVAIFEDKNLSLSMQKALKDNNCSKLMIIALDTRIGKDIMSNLGLTLTAEVIDIVDEVGQIAVQGALNSRRNFRHGIPGSPSDVRNLIETINKQMDGQYIILNINNDSTEVLYIPA